MRAPPLVTVAAAVALLAVPALALADFDADPDGSAPAHPPPACGFARWDVKTLSDPAAGTVDLSPRPGTIDALGRLPAHRVTEQLPRLPGVETTTFRVPARLVAERYQHDHDIHLIVADPATGRTMITELPDPGCRGPAQSAERGAMAKAREQLLRACGPAPAGRFRRLEGSATVTGVGFFDDPHHQPGAAPNAIELHPVLGLSGLRCG